MDIDQFAQNRYLSIATFRKNGAEVKTPVWFARMGDKFYIFSAGDSGKVKRLRNSPKARIAPCDVRGNVKGPFRDTTARVVEDPVLIEKAHRALREKYGWQMWGLDFFAGLAGRTKKRAFIEIDY